MKKLTIFLVAVLGFGLSSISSCQTPEESQELKQMEQIVKKPVKKRNNTFYNVRHWKVCRYYILKPNAEKVELVNQDKAAIQADYEIDLIRVAHIAEADKIVGEY